VVRLLTIAWTELVRLFRDRSNLFFVLVLPLLLVVLIGAAFGGSFDSRVGFVASEGDPVVDALREDLDTREGIEVVTIDDADELTEQVSRNLLSAGLVVPDGFGAALAAVEPVEVGFVAIPDTTALSLQQVVEAVLAEPAAVASASAAAAAVTDVDAAELSTVARALRGQLPQVEVVAVPVGGDELAQEFAGLGRFDLGASTQLFLFTFLTALTGSAGLIQTRQLGVATRMVSTPTPITTVLGGQAAGRIAVALFQAAYIMLATFLLFQVDWGDPLATAAVVVLFCVAAGGAGMLIGSVASNDAQASGLGIGLGIGLAALGGSMVPVEIYPPVMRTVAAFTPHFWANSAVAEIVRRDGGVSDVVGELAMLALFGIVLLALATWRLQRALIR
jgi:ABC-2 type transport system permease protein